VHYESLTDAFSVEPVAKVAALDQRAAQQFRQRVTDNEVVKIPHRLGEAGLRCVLALSEVIVRHMEVNKIARRTELRSQWLRRARNV
jgi:hypothetical protein